MTQEPQASSAGCLRGLSSVLSWAGLGEEPQTQYAHHTAARPQLSSDLCEKQGRNGRNCWRLKRPLSTLSDRPLCATRQRIIQWDKGSKMMFHGPLPGSLFSCWHCTRLKSNIFLRCTTSAQRLSSIGSISEFFWKKHLDYVVGSMEYWCD